MNEGRTVFAQLFDFLPKYEFDKCVARYHGNFRCRKLPAYEQFLVLAFAQLTWRESLRDIETCLASFGPKLYHAGIRQPTSRSTLADANENRDWRIFADFAHVLIRQATTLYANDPFACELQAATYALDSTTIDLCLSLFPWATFRRHKAAIKLHTLLTLQGNFPTVIIVTPARVHDVNILDQLVWEAGAFYIMDRGYLDFARLHRLHQSGAFFVTRARQNFRCARRYSRPVDKATGLRFDQTVVTTGLNTQHDYPVPLRRIGYRDPETGKSFVFLTNNFTVPALTIAQLYRGRWQIELFFKWLKQHLRIKAFYGTSPNAVRTQIWSAIAVYLLVAILKKRLHLEASLYTILQILSLTLFEKSPILQALSQLPLPPASPNIQNHQCLLGF
ncbi:MAG TPA: IS4 family transposase [Verrucomicrobia subdivision 3 bacterium]|nr:IS4 family transposase [Limisphaerales bacterium]